LWLRKFGESKGGGFGEFFNDDLVTEFDTFVADINARSGNKFLNLLLGFAAEGTLKQIASFANTSHG
jgi:hypothetical protein